VAGSGCTQTGALTEVLSGTVTANNTKSTRPGAAVSATECVVPSATTPGLLKISLLPGTKFVIGT
jgi:hypothetical protein